MVENLTAETFREKVFDYKNEKEWKYRGELPCIIDFYADWCGPCKMVSPILDELSEEYTGKIKIYKINTETEKELASVFQIMSIPTILFIALGKDPQGVRGALPKSEFEKKIKEWLL
ncbi:thioredoxin [Candidatus Woesearchaeota archaeon]|jgi:thioredoxin 1|nr:thioredoxin [Candidatus Woesearchaeota archaeon]MBT7237382.1 thioredoxin [Candidatus Woesearchaeota archaeon]